MAIPFARPLEPHNVPGSCGWAKQSLQTEQDGTHALLVNPGTVACSGRILIMPLGTYLGRYLDKYLLTYNVGT